MDQKNRQLNRQLLVILRVKNNNNKLNYLFSILTFETSASRVEHLSFRCVTSSPSFSFSRFIVETEKCNETNVITIPTYYLHGTFKRGAHHDAKVSATNC